MCQGCAQDKVYNQRMKRTANPSVGLSSDASTKPITGRKMVCLATCAGSSPQKAGLVGFQTNLHF